MLLARLHDDLDRFEAAFGTSSTESLQQAPLQVRNVEPGVDQVEVT